MFKIYRVAQENNSNNPYWMSFSDAISGLLIIFILATVYLMYSMQEREKILSQQVNDDITNMRRILFSEGIIVEIDDNIMRIPTSEIHFANNQSEIPPEMTENVDKIGKIVIDYVKNKNKNLEAVFIEGHTDCNPTTRDLRGNMGLSVDRAITIAKEWERLDSEFWNIKNKDGKPLFSVSGYGEMRPVPGTMLVDCEYETPENLAKNRRIDIRFVVGRPNTIYLKDMRYD